MPDPLSLALTAIVALAAVIVAAILAAADAGLTAMPDPRLMAAKDEGGRYEATADRLLADRISTQTRLLAARIIFISLPIGVTVHETEPLAAWISVTAVSVVVATYGAFTAIFTTYVHARPRFALPLLYYLRPLELAMALVAFPLTLLARLGSRLFPPPRQSMVVDEAAVREVEHMIEEQEEKGAIDGEFAELVLSVLEFKDTIAREVMIPRTRMVSFDINTPVPEVLDIIEAKGHSRYPVHRGRVDDVVGILYAKDFFRVLRKSGAEEVRLEELIRTPVFFVAESHKIGALLREMQARRFHLAVVVDEFGGTSGLVTLEDIVEEIVGEIEDEHDKEEAPIREVEPGRTYIADATVSIYDLGRFFDTEFEEDGNYDSLGGMIVDKLENRLPSAGTSLSVGAFDFIVREADERHVTRVEIVRRAGVEASVAVE